MTDDKKKPADRELFREMMSDVKPLAGKKSAQKIAPAKPRPSPTSGPTDPGVASSPGFFSRDHVPEVAPEEALFFARSGLQHRLLRQLKRGSLPIEARLDLHGCTLAEAGIQLAEFLQQCQDRGLRSVCLVHGKGHRSAEGRPVLKTHINQWLRDTPAVLAFSSALPRDGGMGALYVLLRRR
ncbi:MAG: Smr/MutS family protein [Gammaproteobacteria bacterium]|nr:Smr/MutS family protein [Gammaproteobacteria bacterium]